MASLRTGLSPEQNQVYAGGIAAAANPGRLLSPSGGLLQYLFRNMPAPLPFRYGSAQSAAAAERVRGLLRGLLQGQIESGGF